MDTRQKVITKTHLAKMGLNSHHKLKPLYQIFREFVCYRHIVNHHQLNLYMFEVMNNNRIRIDLTSIAHIHDEHFYINNLWVKNVLHVKVQWFHFWTYQKICI